MADNMKMQLIFEALNNTGNAFESLRNSLDSLSGKASIFSAKFAAIDYAARRAFQAISDAIKPAYDAVEQFNMSVVKMSAMLTSFQTTGDLAENFQKSKAYAEALIEKLEEIDAKTIASASDLGLITEEMVKQRVLLDINSEKQVQGFTNIANAVATVAAGSGAKEIQLRQEIRALLQGEVNMYSQLASQLDSMVGGSLKQKVELWKKEGTIIENIGGLLQGYAAAAQDLEGTWAAIGSTMDTIKKQVLRDGFVDAYKEINITLQNINEHLKEHKNTISGAIKQGWLSVKGLVESLINIFKPFTPLLSLAGQLIGVVAQGLGLIAYTILPPLTERIGLVIKSMLEWVALLGNIGSAFWKMLQLDFKGAAEEAKQAQENFRLSGEYAGKAFSGGFGDEVAKRYNEFTKGISKTSATVKKPDLGKSPESDNEKAEVRAGVDARLKVEMQALKQAEEQEVESLKTREKNLDLSYRQGVITEQEYLAEKNRLQIEAVSIANVYSELEKKNIEAAWNDKKGQFKEEKDRLKESGDVKAELLKRDMEINKRNEEISRLGIDSKIQDVEYTKRLAEAEREGTLKVLEARIGLEKEIVQLKLQSGEINPVEAAQQEVALEERLLKAQKEGLEAKLKGHLTDAEKVSISKEIETISLKIADTEAVRLKILEAQKRELSQQNAEREAALKTALNQVDIAEQAHEISKTEAISRRLELSQELLKQQEAYLSSIDKAKDAAAWYAQSNAIDDTRKNVLKLNEALREQTGTLGEGIKEGLRDYIDNIRTTFQHGVELTKSAAEGMEKAFSDFFFDAMNLKFKSLTSYIRSVLTTLQRAVAEMLSKSALQWVIMGAKTLLGGYSAMSGGTSTVDAGSPVVDGFGGEFAFAHTGGLISDAYIPRYHLGIDEVPAILQTRERVLSREQNVIFSELADLLIGIKNGRGGAAEPKTTNNNYYIQAFDSKSFHEFVRQHPDAITAVLADDARGAGSIRNIVRSVS